MGKHINTYLYGFLFAALTFSSCDDGRIYDEPIQVEREGGSVRLTAQLSGQDHWASGYSIVLAGFSDDSEYAKTARERGIGVIIAGAGGAAHVAGVVAGLTTVPVIGVPMQTKALGGLDSLLSIVQMPAGVPVATVAINGAKNAALIAASILALQDSGVAERLEKFRRDQTGAVLEAEI